MEPLRDICAFGREYLPALFASWWSLAFLLFAVNEMSEWLFKRSFRWMHAHRFIVACALIIIAQAVAYRNLSERAKADLRMTVTSYRYSSETREVIANVQFVNRGPIRRIVLGAMFTYKPENESLSTASAAAVGGVGGGRTVHYIIDSAAEFDQSDLQAPIYVEPGQPILTTFRHKVRDEALFQTPGTVFGLEVKSLTASGGGNVTWVEVMEVVADLLEDQPKAIGFVMGRRETFHWMKCSALLRWRRSAC
jgi:hypothetical protein